MLSPATLRLTSHPSHVRRGSPARISMDKLGFFCEKLMDGMAKSGLSQKMTAVRLGCSYEYVRKMIRGERLPSPSLLNKLCSIFHWKTKKIERLVHLEVSKAIWANLLDCSRQEPALRAALHVVAVLTPGEKQMIIHLLRPWRTRQEGRATAEHRG